MDATNAIAVRGHTAPVNGWSKRPEGRTDKPDFTRLLAVDNETTVDEREALKFGTAILHVQRKPKAGWIFYHRQNVSDDDLKTLKIKADEHGFGFLPLDDFLNEVFLPEVHDNKTPCVGFNLPFDISRLANKWGPARGYNVGGFSFILSKDYPRLIIKHVNSHLSFIKFANARIDKDNPVDEETRTFKGYFLDLRTATFALTSESLTLDGACKYFGVPGGKMGVTGHGKITLDYVEYNINDVIITGQLFFKVLDAYNEYHLDLPINRVYSPATIGKAYLTEMDVRSFLALNPDFPQELMGNTMSTYFGGRAEVRIRCQPTHVRLLDFLSMYPTMCGVLRMWKYVIAENIVHFDDTERIQDFIEHVELDDLRKPEAWRMMNAIVLVHPQDDVLMVRSQFNELTYNLGTAYVTSPMPLWYTVADVVASKLSNQGKVPRISKAIRFVPVGIQQGLKPITIIGGKTVDPAKDDFFMALAEHRNNLKRARDAIDQQQEPDEYKHLDSCQNAVKIILNATSYGIFVQQDVVPEAKTLMVYGPCGCSEKKLDKYERPGAFFNPIIATFITAAARLVLAITEAILAKHDAVYAFCDTDSMAVPAEYVEEVQSFFRPLSPYSFKAEMFKLEKYNFEGKDDKKGELVDLQFYGISAKRYVLYYVKDGKRIIQKASNHGLGYLKNPFSWVKGEWQDKVWADILDLHYGDATWGELREEYSDLFAIMDFTVSSPDLLKRFAKMDKGKPYNDRVRPFNFLLLGSANTIDPKTEDDVKPLAAFNQNGQVAAFGDFIDYNSGKTMRGQQYWKPMDIVLKQFLVHPEAKFDGDVGILQRKHIEVKSVATIGKESNNLEWSNYFGLNEEDLITYDTKVADGGKGDADQELKAFILSNDPKDLKLYGIGKRQLDRWKRLIREGAPLHLEEKSEVRLRRAMRVKEKLKA